MQCTKICSCMPCIQCIDCLNRFCSNCIEKFHTAKCSLCNGNVWHIPTKCEIHKKKCFICQTKVHLDDFEQEYQRRREITTKIHYNNKTYESHLCCRHKGIFGEVSNEINTYLIAVLTNICNGYLYYEEENHLALCWRL